MGRVLRRTWLSSQPDLSPWKQQYAIYLVMMWRANPPPCGDWMKNAKLMAPTHPVGFPMWVAVRTCWLLNDKNLAEQLWHAMGDFHYSRFYSKALVSTLWKSTTISPIIPVATQAIQIKAREIGLVRDWYQELINLLCTKEAVSEWLRYLNAFFGTSKLINTNMLLHTQNSTVLNIK